jgi:WD40 repeat protein
MRQGFVFALFVIAVTPRDVGAQDGKPFANLTLEGKFRWITYMAFSPDGKTFAASHCWSHGPSFVTLWDAANGKHLRKINGPEGVLSYNPLVFSPDGKWLAVGGIGEILLLDPATGKQAHQMKVPDTEVLHLAFDPGTKLLASCGRGKDVLLWEVATGKKRATLPFDRPFVFAVAFSANKQTITAVGFAQDEGESSGWVVQVWDAATFKPIRKLAGKEKDTFQVVRLSPDGRVLAVRKKGIVELWDTVDGKQSGSIKSRGKDWVMHFTLTGDGNAVMTLHGREKEKGTLEGHLDLWDSRSGKNLSSRDVTSERIEKEFGPYCVFPPGSELAAFQVGESEMALWRTRALLKELLQRKPRE